MKLKSRMPRPFLRVLSAAALAALTPVAHAVVFEWLSGDYVAAGLPNPLAAADVVNASGAGAKSFGGGVVNNGRINWLSTVQTTFTAGSTSFVNNGVFDFAGNGWLRPLAANITFDNAGTLRKSGGSGDLFVDTVLLNRAGGVLAADSGVMNYRSSGTLAGGTVFTGTGGRHVFETGAGTYTFTGGFTAGANNVEFARGTFNANSATRIDPGTNLNWSGGVLQGNWGNAAGRTLIATDGFGKTFASNFTNDGAIAWNSANQVEFAIGNTTLRNNGSFTFAGDGWLRPIAANITFDNAGTLRKSGGSGDLFVDTVLLNRAGGVLAADSGVMNYRSSGTLAGGTVFIGTGGRHVFETGAGTYTFTGGFTAGANNVEFARGTFNANSATRIDPGTNLNWSGGVLQGNWGNAAGRTLTATDGFGKTFASNFTNDGAIAWNSANQVEFAIGNTTLRNNGSFTFAGDGWLRPIAANITFDNAGTLRKSGGSGDLLVGTALNNTGAIESLSGRIVLPSNWRNDGTLRGTAGFQTNVLTNAGVVAPGLAGAPNAATLTFTGALVQAATGFLSFDVGSGGISDLLNVSGVVSFAGRVLVNPIAGYVPQVGDTFRVMSFAGFNGSLAGVDEPAFGAGVEFTAIYSATALDLRVTAVPEPGMWSLMLFGLAFLLHRLRRRPAGAPA